MIRFNKVKATCLEIEGTVIIVDCQTNEACIQNYITDEVIIESELDNELNFTVMQ